jgi:hypothetical protein
VESISLGDEADGKSVVDKLDSGLELGECESGDSIGGAVRIVVQESLVGG